MPSLVHTYLIAPPLDLSLTLVTSPRDDRILVALRDALAATGAFGIDPLAQIDIGTDENEKEFNSGQGNGYAFIWVRSEMPEPFEANGDGTYTLKVDGRFEVQICVSENDDRRRAHRLGRLTAIVRNALRDNDLGGLVDPDWTMTGQSQEPRRLKMRLSQPNAERVIPGTYRFYINSDSGFDEADDEFA